MEYCLAVDHKKIGRKHKANYHLGCLCRGVHGFERRPYSPAGYGVYPALFPCFLDALRRMICLKQHCYNIEVICPKKNYLLQALPLTKVYCLVAKPWAD